MRDNSKVSGFRYAPEYTILDSGDHKPTDVKNWNESSVLVYADPDSGVAGYQRIGAFVNQKKGNLYSWQQAGGRNLSRVKLSSIELPPGPVTNTTLRGLTYETIEPAHKIRVRVDRDNAVTDIVFESYTGPVAWTVNMAGFEMAAGHYECMGSVKGSVTAGGVVYPVNGVGFIDHSWGPRDYSTVYSCRWLMAALDADNHLSAWPLIATNGLGMHGYLVLDGKLSRVKTIESELCVGTDQLHLNSGRYVITDELGRTLELSAKSVGEHSVQPFGQGLYAVHQPAVFEGMGGRQAKGMIEWTPPRAIPTSELELMGMSRDDEWLRIVPVI